jgi:hypothetical protein
MSALHNQFLLKQNTIHKQHVEEWVCENKLSGRLRNPQFLLWDRAACHLILLV